MGTQVKSGRVLSAKTLIGDTIKNSQGENLGKLEEIMFDTTEGRIAYGVVSYGGFMGLGSKLFAVPWQAFRVDTDQHALILDVPKERLQNAPGFDKDSWPDMADRTWAESLHTHYGYRGYWTSQPGSQH